MAYFKYLAYYEITSCLKYFGERESEHHKDLDFCIEKYLLYNPQLEDELSYSFSDDQWEIIDEWQHMGNFLCNICQVEDGRKIVMYVPSAYLSRLLGQIRSKNPTRRRGAVGCIRR